MTQKAYEKSLICIHRNSRQTIERKNGGKRVFGEMTGNFPDLKN